MSKRSKKLIIPFAAVLTALFAVIMLLQGAGAFSSLQSADFSRDEYRAKLGEMYSQYNTDWAYKEFENGNEFAFSRLLVNNYNGKNYGQKLCAYDEENGFAVLQFESPADAEKAYKEIESDGMPVDAESTAQLCESEKGSLYPAGSNALGTPQYLSKFAMGSEAVTVALIDTGVMYDHEEFEGRFVSGGYDYSEDKCADAYFDTDMQGDVYGHATFIAGIIANNTPDSVRILPYKVVPFGHETALASALISAINDAVTTGAKVINISISCASSAKSYIIAVKNAKANGVCICAAAGNQSTEIKELYPASIEEAITVTALKSDISTIASYSNHGSVVDFCAPGSKIISTAPYVNNTDAKYRQNSGTSFAAPYIAALCADIKTINNDMPVDDVCTVLADFAADLGAEGRDDYYGNGLPNLSDMEYTDGESYTFNIPEGTLSVYGERDYTASTQPWRIFADRLISVEIDESIDRIGDYNFYYVKRSAFTKSEIYDKIGKYAFYGCENVKSATFTIDCAEVGEGAFGGIDNFVINGYRNTPAEAYALSESITFNALGCKHNYNYEIIDPTETEEGYTVYTCSVCGDSYVGPYIFPNLIHEGTCGNGLTYAFYDTGKLTIDGNGMMYSYTFLSAPWAEYADEINTIEIKAGVSRISQFAFYGCNNLIRIRCASANPSYSAVDGVLYSKDGSELVLMPNSGAYTMPASVTSFTAKALIIRSSAIAFNDNFSVADGIVYDANGNIICALQSYSADMLKINNDIIINDYAFILTDYPENLSVDTKGVEFGTYSVGYRFNGSLSKSDMLIKTYDSGSARNYAVANTFALSTYNKGTCGNNASWYYDADNHVLTISGTGTLYDYTAVSDLPWSEYLPVVKEIVIEDGITALCSNAFINCESLQKLTLYSKNCTIPDYSLFAYNNGNYGFYSQPVMYGFDDSTAKDYCAKFNLNFSSLGCGHSRDTVLTSTVEYPCCFDNEYLYHCLDCDGDFTEYIPTTDGHCVTGVARTPSGKGIAYADVYVDGRLSAVTNWRGAFVADYVKCGTHTITLSREGESFVSAQVVVDKSDTTGEFVFPYGDYNSDGFVNGRDLAFAKINGITDYKSFDFGSTMPQITLDEKVDEDITPFAYGFNFSQYQDSPYRKVFTVHISNPGKYAITTSGFLYGKELDEDDLVLEKADTFADNGNMIRNTSTIKLNYMTKELVYGLSAGKSWFGVRFYIIYTNGVNTHIYYSDVYKYNYEAD